MMAEAQADDDLVQLLIMAERGANEIFVYMGGDQVVPMDVRRVSIDKSVKIISNRAFDHRYNLIHVEFHDGIEIIGKWAFGHCPLLRGPIKLLGVKIIKARAFCDCRGLTEVEFGGELETIEAGAFQDCTLLRSITMPTVRTIGRCAFIDCLQLTDLDLPEGLETIEGYAFDSCQRLRRITMAMPLNFVIDADVFNLCRNLTTVELVGGIHNTIASLHLESWRNQMKGEIIRINQVLPGIFQEKGAEIREWMRSVISQLDHYKAQHRALLKEATTQLELALWKANLDDNEGGALEKEGVRTTRGRRKRARKEICVTSGASIVIKNVLPFLTLLE